MLAIGATLLHFLGWFAPSIATTLGDIWIKSKQTQVESDKVGVSAGHEYLQSVTEANRSRVAARKAEGSWGPLGLVTMWVGAAIAFHLSAVVLDSVPLFGHVVGSWKIAALPGDFQAVELEAIRALFYTAPPSAAAIAVARVFRR